jgi:hypothetical protein
MTPCGEKRSDLRVHSNRLRNASRAETCFTLAISDWDSSRPRGTFQTGLIMHPSADLGQKKRTVASPISSVRGARFVSNRSSSCTAGGSDSL